MIRTRVTTRPLPALATRRKRRQLLSTVANRIILIKGRRPHLQFHHTEIPSAVHRTADDLRRCGEISSTAYLLFARTLQARSPQRYHVRDALALARKTSLRQDTIRGSHPDWARGTRFPATLNVIPAYAFYGTRPKLRPW